MIIIIFGFINKIVGLSSLRDCRCNAICMLSFFLLKNTSMNMVERYTLITENRTIL
jgi:hypothetical protein